MAANPFNVTLRNTSAGTSTVQSVTVGTTAEQFFAAQFPDTDLNSVTAIVRRQGQTVDTIQEGTNFLLEEGDTVTVTPRNVKGA